MENADLVSSLVKTEYTSFQDASVGHEDMREDVLSRRFAAIASVITVKETPQPIFNQKLPLSMLSFTLIAIATYPAMPCSTI